MNRGRNSQFVTTPEGSSYLGQLFSEIETLRNLMIKAEDKCWLERPPAQPTRRATVLYLGCNVFRTPHLAQTAVAIFERMNEDFVALGGAAFCCGLPHERERGISAGRRQASKLTAQLESFQPYRVVMWCPNCLYFYRQVVPASLPFQLLHITEFLAETRTRLPFDSLSPTRIALHYHSGSADAEGQASAIRATLSAIEGVELVEIGSDPAWGPPCSGIQRDRLGRDAWAGLIRRFFEKAAAGGADIFATPYHGCHRMYAGYEKELPFAIEHYLTVVAQALGIAYPDRYKQYLLWKDPARILEDARPCIEANELPVGRAGAVIERVFVNDRGL